MHSHVMLGQENPYQTQIDSLERVLAKHPQADTVQGRILFQLTLATLNAGDQARALQLDSQALALSQALHWESGEAEAQEKFGRIYMRKGVYDQATRHYQLALEMREALGDRESMAGNLNNLGVLQQYQGKYDEAVDYFQQTAALTRELADTLTLVVAISNLANIASHYKDHEQAMAYLNQAIELQSGSSYTVYLPHNYITLGNILRKKGRLPEALVALRNALGEYEKQEQVVGQITAWRNLGRCYKDRRDIDSAKYCSHQALDLATVTQNIREVGNAESTLGSLYLATSEYEAARDHYKGAVHAFQQIQNPKWLASSMVSLGNIFMKLNQLDSAIVYFQQLAAVANISEEPDVYIDTYFRMGRSYHSSGLVPMAQESYLEAYGLALATGNQYNEAKALNNMASLASTQKNVEKAKSYYLQAAQIHQAIEEYDWLLSDMEGLANTLMSLENHDSALVCLETCTELFASLNRRVSPQILQLKGRAYFLLEEWDQAEFYFRKSLALFEQGEDLKGQANSKRYLGNVFYERKEFVEAKRWLQESLDDALTTNSLFSQSGSHRSLAKVYAQLGQGMKAYEHHQVYMSLKDRLLNEENLRKSTRLEEQFAFDQEKQALLQAQEQEEMLLQAEINRQRIVQWALAGGAGLLLLVMAQGALSYRRKQMQNRQIAAKNTQISEQNTQLKSLSRFREVWTHMVAHDMKNSLNTIMGLAVPSPPPDVESITRINESGRVMLDLVTNMLDVQKLEEANVALNRSTVPVHELVEKARGRVVFLYQTGGIQLMPEIPQPYYLSVDAEMMVRVLVNLLSNAAKYSKPNTQVRVVCQSAQGTLTLQVIDEGKGIPEADLPHIFEKYYQVEARSAGHAASNGLGLTFCKLAVEAHGGTLAVASTLGKGTTFTMALPEVTGHVPASSTEELVGSDPVSTPAISEEVKTALQPYVDALQHHEVFEATDILAVLESLPEALRTSEWKHQVEQAVIHGDGVQYQALLQQVAAVRSV
ncbi:MAG: tetratricopeptide repeat protein [Bacteroidota bacterium]